MLRVIKKHLLKKILDSIVPGDYFLCFRLKLSMFSFLLIEEIKMLNLLLERSSNKNLLLPRDYVEGAGMAHKIFMRQVIIEKMIDLLDSKESTFVKTLMIEESIKIAIEKKINRI